MPGLPPAGTPAAGTYTIEDAETHIATLRGQADLLSEALTQDDITAGQVPNTPAAGYVQYSSAGHQKYVSSDTGTYNTGTAHVFGAPAQTINTLTSTNAITGASAPVDPGTYILTAVVFCTNGSTGANQAVGFNGPAASTVNVLQEIVYTQNTANPIQLGSTRQTSYGALYGVSGNGQTIIAGGYTFAAKLRGWLTFTAIGTFTLCAACLTLATDTFTVNAFEFDLSPAT